MSESLLFAIGCGVTFLFLGGVYIVLRTQFSEAYGGTSELDEVQGDAVDEDLPLKWPDRPRAATARSGRPKRAARL